MDLVLKEFEEIVYYELKGIFKANFYLDFSFYCLVLGIIMGLGLEGDLLFVVGYFFINLQAK